MKGDQTGAAAQRGFRTKNGGSGHAGRTGQNAQPAGLSLVKVVGTARQKTGESFRAKQPQVAIVRQRKIVHRDEENPARPRDAGLRGQAELWDSHREGEVHGECPALSGVGIHARWQVHGGDHGTAAITKSGHFGREVRERSSQGSLRADAKQPVEQKTGTGLAEDACRSCSGLLGDGFVLLASPCGT